MIDEQKSVNEELNSLINEGKIIEVGRPIQGLWRFDMTRENSEIKEMERQVRAMLVVDEDKTNPLDALVHRIESEGYSLPFVFEEIDANKDELLTLLEIKQGLEALEIFVSGSELSELQE